MYRQLRLAGFLGLVLTVSVGVAWLSPAQEPTPVERLGPPDEQAADDVSPPPSAPAGGQRDVQDASQNEDMTVLGRGPIHEAYAQPDTQTAQDSPVVPKAPPEPITEVPPDQKPEGDNVQWIPGYWGWDPARQDFVWVSGFWRVPPPGRHWVPGHWAQVEGGYQWVPGLWAAADRTDIEYLPPPPDSLDNGPSTPPPDDNSFYSPGCWVYRSDRYAWQPGRWIESQPGYIWNPPHYCDTPAGSVFVGGYWDYPLEDRGVLFAPVCFNRPLWQNPDWYYQPSYCVDQGGLLASLFVWPHHHHYYFGDYYGERYRDMGFRPWYAHRGPLFEQYAHEHRDDPRWLAGLRQTYQGRVHGDLPVPPHTLAQQARLYGNGARGNHDLHLLRPLRDVPTMNEHVHLARLSQAQAAQYRHAEQHYRELSVQRQHLERPGRAVAGRGAESPRAHLTAEPYHVGHAAEVHQPAAHHEAAVAHHESWAPHVPEVRHPVAPAHHVPLHQAETPVHHQEYRQPEAPVHHQEYRQPAAHHEPAAVPHVPAAPHPAEVRHAPAPAMPAPQHRAAPAPAMPIPQHHAAPAPHPAPAWHPPAPPHHAAPAPAHHAAPAPAGGHGGHHH